MLSSSIRKHLPKKSSNSENKTSNNNITKPNDSFSPKEDIVDRRESYFTSSEELDEGVRRKRRPTLFGSERESIFGN